METEKQARMEAELAESFNHILTAFAGPHLGTYLSGALPSDRKDALTVLKQLARCCPKSSFAPASPASSGPALDAMVMTSTRDFRVGRELPPPEPNARVLAVERGRVDTNGRGHASATRSAPGPGDAGELEVVSLYGRDFQDWHKAGMATQTANRDRTLDWGKEGRAAFACRTEEPEDRAFFQECYQTVYEATISGSRKDTTDRGSLTGEPMVMFYAGDLIKRRWVPVVAAWLDGESHRTQTLFKDVMRRLDDFLKKTTTASGHDWRTVASGTRAAMQVTKHAYDSSHSLVNTGTRRVRVKLKPERDADPGDEVTLAEEEASAIRARIEHTTGGADYARPTVDARRGTSLATEGYGMQGTRAPSLTQTTYGMAFCGEEDARRMRPQRRSRAYHHLPSQIPDMPLGKKADQMQTTYASQFQDKTTASRRYIGRSVQETNPWSVGTSI